MRLLRRCFFGFRTITPEDYLFNQREALCAQSSRNASLKPLPGSNQGDIDLIDEIKLIGVPRSKSRAHTSPLHDEVQVMTAGGADLLFLQIDPSEYIARQRFMSHKCAMGKVEDYRLDGIELVDPLRPVTWEETVVNLFVLDMLVSNSLPSKTTYKNGLYAYSYPFLQDEPETRKQITPSFVDAISTHILGNQLNDYPIINRFLYTALMARHKVMLGGMPETLYKLILGKALSIHELRDIFRTILLKNKELSSPFPLSKAAENFMPHIFLLPKDLYMTALMKESFQASTQMVCTVGIEHYRPIQEYWIGPPHGVNLT